MNKRELELYIHIPFCARKCAYCDFLSFAVPERVYRDYMDKLLEEICGQGPNFQEYRVSTIFVGGGTPSILPADLIMELFATLSENFDISLDAEITMEANPGTLTMEKLEVYRQSGVNRLSIGLQSADDKELKYLGRIHTAKQFAENYQAARRVGFENINIDLMSALPGQTTASWLDTLNKTAALEPEHLSAYSLIIEEGTPFWDFYGDDRSGEADVDGIIADGGAGQQGKAAIPALPDEDSERQMYHLTKRILAEKEYERYEISNYARKGFECRHNLIYWQRKDYLGLGLGAASMVGDRRFSNVSDMTSYMHDWSYCQEEILDRKAQIEETMFLGLRCTAGVSDRVFTEKFGQSMMDIYGDIIRKYLSEGFLVFHPSEGRLAFSEAGTDVSNWILSDFLL